MDKIMFIVLVTTLLPSFAYSNAHIEQHYEDQDCITNKDDQTICSNHGHCSLGYCVCDELYSGDYCQHSIYDYSLPCPNYYKFVKCLIEERLGITQCTEDKIDEALPDISNEDLPIPIFVWEDIDNSVACKVRIVKPNIYGMFEYVAYRDKDAQTFLVIRQHPKESYFIAMLFCALVLALLVSLFIFAIWIYRTRQSNSDDQLGYNKISQTQILA